MKILTICAALSISMTGAAVAQPAPDSSQPGAAPPAAQPAPPAPATSLNGDTPIETLVANSAAKAVVTKIFPDLQNHPAFDQFKSMSLRQLEPLSGGLITDEKIAALEAGLKDIK